ncbi:Faf1p NDAI_0G02010 [Naumovozyma dairenensis CBS 421]|uniref:Protein FAF1 n=1 Tax=Naumovozyma dairenensis (strain ATCC 10597 / BCRC 20456 / CBS 421 / NBRC 0211 / NRRL Y-12639) TaxID=1071378 RepID=G0WDW5_NAUDC|nr:hypothetical protein NDAI_0G02010 [Naumovozyma dairenensis CBS 421]CCD25976.2 hypothetical protein NDAI_0G02010 [Naumovozyma dairenensis CBS 421]
MGSNNNNSDEDTEYLKALEAQRLAFESQFGSLESMGFEDKTKDITVGSDSSSHNSDSDINDNNNDDDEEEDSENDGDSDSDSDIDVGSRDNETKVTEKSSSMITRGPKVITFNGPADDFIAPSKKDKKLLSSGKSLIHTIIKEQESEEREMNDNKNDNENLEEENLQNDIELQQFLKESHLLSAFNNNNSTSSSITSGVALTLQGMNGSKSDSIAYQDDQVMGKARARTLEMRLNGLSKINGHSKNIDKLEKVPMHVRKGMIKKHVERIQRYEKDAAEGGIVLSKVKKGQFRKIESTYKKDIERRIGQSIKRKDIERNTRRERGLKINTIGRSTRNGLVVSKSRH